MRRRPARSRGNDNGFTLVELLIAMSIFAVVVSLATGAMIELMTLSHGTEARVDAQFDLRSGLDDIDKQMRSGNVLYSPKNEPSYVGSCEAATNNSDAGSCMRIYTQTGGVPRCVQWQVLQVSPGAGHAILRTRSWSPDWQTNGDVTGWHTVARDMTLGSTMPFQLVNDTSAPNPTATAAPAGGIAAYQQRLLAVTLFAHDDDKGNDVKLTTSLSGRNTSYGYDTGQCVPVPTE